VRWELGLGGQRIVVLGAGTAGLGVSECIIYGMQQFGMSAADARKNMWLVDDKGLLGVGRQGASQAQLPFIRGDMPDKLFLLEVVKRVKPTILMGLSGVGQTFTEDIVREMAKHVDRPIVFPLSNPTSRAECTAAQAFEWTNGKCIFASGSPFDPVTLPSGQVCVPNQGNNMFVFPGIGYGTLPTRWVVAPNRNLIHCGCVLVFVCLCLCVCLQVGSCGMCRPYGYGSHALHGIDDISCVGTRRGAQARAHISAFA
jgi:malic enzyme